MDSPYRDARTPLQERREALRTELEATRTQVEALQAAESRQHELAAELQTVERTLRRADARRPLPLLGQIRIAAPCTAQWDDMVGDDTTRWCGSCAKNVYNLSTMTAGEAEDFLEETFGTETCVRFYRRADGTILTSDCPVGTSRRRVKRIAGAALAVATTAAGAGAAFLAGSPRGPVMGATDTVSRYAPPAPEAPHTTVQDDRHEMGGKGGFIMGAPPPVKQHRAQKCAPGEPLCADE